VAHQPHRGSQLRRGILSFALLVILVSWSSGASASPKVDCGSFDTSTCGVTADPHEGQFHGVIVIVSVICPVPNGVGCNATGVEAWNRVGSPARVAAWGWVSITRSGGVTSRR
jgi:hypothetical protein